MLQITDLRIGTKIVVDGDPYVITQYSQSKQARGGSVVRVSIKNLINGSKLQKTFQGNDQLEEADIERTKAQFTYKDGDNYNFMDGESYEQFVLTTEQLGDAVNYLVESQEIDIINFKEVPVCVELKAKVDLKVVSTPPGVKGDTASGGSKPATLETGLIIQVPLFIKEGDLIRVNTETQEYVERA